MRLRKALVGENEREYLMPNDGETLLYVAGDGNDNWSGGLAQPTDDGTDGPLRTLERARDRIREWRAGTASGETRFSVLVRAGVYPLRQAFTLEEADSGSREHPIVYRSHPGEQAVLSGGVAVPESAWAAVRDPAVLRRLQPAARGQVMELNLPALGMDSGTYPDSFLGAPEVPELFFNDIRMTVAHWPNDGWTTIANIVEPGSATSPAFPSGNEGGVFEYADDRPSRWNVDAGVWLHGYWCYDWAPEVVRVKSIAREQRRITLSAPTTYGVRAGNPSPRRFYALNVLEELDRPGEYVVDVSTGMLYFWPPVPLRDGRVVLSALKTPIIAVRNAAFIECQGFVVEAGLGDGIAVEDACEVRIRDCHIRNMRLSGIAVTGGSGCAVEGCDVHDTGTGGIRLKGGDRKTLTPGGHAAINNHVFRFAMHKRTYSNAIWIQGVGHRAAHNLVHDAPHQAIAIEGNDNLFEYNIVHHVCMETDDCGAFYKGRNPSCRGNVIRYNYWHDIGRPMGHGNAAIYLDDGDGGETVFGNVFLRCGNPGKGGFGAIMSHGGHDIAAENNVFIECRRAFGSWPWDDAGWKKCLEGDLWQRLLLEVVDITRPPYTTRYPALIGFLDPQPGQARVNRAVRNVLVRCDAVGCGNWQVRETENWITDQDPGFANAAAGDYRLEPDAAVFARLAGFADIPFAKIGLLRERGCHCR